ncbi:MAG TPA: VOC family protein [Ilumatobacteraceae bacterium]|nr:VOC family protein [Ilumatobacteraceae bacterium]
MSATRFDLVTFDSPATDELARFWSAAADLHEVEREDVDRWIVLADRGGVRRIGIQRGNAQPGSIHLDLACAPDMFDIELDRLLTLGARALAEPRVEPYGSIANLCDPDGNRFDLCAYS